MAGTWCWRWKASSWRALVRELRQISTVRPHFTLSCHLHCTAQCTALLLVWVKIPMEILMRTWVKTQARGKPREWLIHQNRDSIRRANARLPDLLLNIFPFIWGLFFGLNSQPAQSPPGKIEHKIVCFQYNQLVVWPPWWLMPGNFPSISKSPLQLESSVISGSGHIWVPTKVTWGTSGQSTVWALPRGI